jgi:hypothetical protein
MVGAIFANLQRRVGIADTTPLSSTHLLRSGLLTTREVTSRSTPDEQVVEPVPQPLQRAAHGRLTETTGALHLV